VLYFLLIANSCMTVEKYMTTYLLHSYWLIALRGVMLCAVCKLAGEREHLLALFSFTSGPTSDIIAEFVSTYQLPVLSVAPGVDQSVRRRLRQHQHRRPTTDHRGLSIYCSV